MLAAANISGIGWRGMYFASPSVLRLLSGNELREFDVAQKKLTLTGTLPASIGRWPGVSGDASRLYVRENATIYDARTGAVIAALPVKAVAPYASAIMNDGRIAVITTDGAPPNARVLRLFDRDGRELKSMPMPTYPRTGIRAQIGDSQLVIGTGAGTIVADVDRGTVSAEQQNLRGPMVSWSDMKLPRVDENAAVMAAEGKKLVLWNPQTGERKPFPL